MVDRTMEIERPFGAGIPGYTKTVYRGMGNCVCCGETVFACTCPAPKFRQPVSGSQHDVDPGPVIIVSTGGDNYSVLDRVDPRIKKLAVEGQLELPGRTDESNVYHDTRVFSATEETLTEALGPNENNLTPENKYWIMKALWFKPVGKYQWTHPVTGDEIIWFDINTHLMMHPILEVFRAGRKHLTAELASQVKKAP